MIQEVRTYFIKLCLILLGGYGFCCANPVADQTRPVRVKQLSQSAYTRCVNSQTSSSRFVNLSSGREKTIKIFTEKDEEEDGELSRPRTFTTVSIYFSAIYTWTLQIFFTCLKAETSFCYHWFHYSSCRYIILRVIRL